MRIVFAICFSSFNDGFDIFIQYRKQKKTFYSLANNNNSNGFTEVKA